MKLQLNNSHVVGFAAKCGSLTGCLEGDTRTVLNQLKADGHDPFTRKDVTAILIAMGLPERPGKKGVADGDLAWRSISAICSQMGRSVSGRRGYSTQFEPGTQPTAPIVIAAPKKKAKKVAVVPSEPTVTGRWFEAQIRDNALDRKVAALLKRKFSLEQYDDLLSEVHEWFVKWSNAGTCDAFISDGRPPTLTILTVWMEGKLTHRLYKEAQDALNREFKGVRTQGEVRVMKRTGSDHIRPDARLTDPNAPAAVKVGDEEEGTRRHEFVAPEVDNTPMFEDEELDLARDIVRVRRRRAADRYARYFDHLMSGRTKEETAALEGDSTLRVTHLYQRVRDDLSAAPLMLQVAMKVLQTIAEEPFSTVADIAEELPRTERTVENKDLKQALDFLVIRDLVFEGAGSSFCPTDRGHEAAESGSFLA